MSRPIPPTSLLVLALALGLVTESAQAQSRGLFGSGNSALSATSTRPSARGAGSNAGSAFSQAGGSGFAGPQLSGTDRLGALSEQIGQGPFIGGSDNAGRFVGNERVGQQTLQGSRPQFVRGGGGAGGFNATNRQTTPADQPAIRPQLRIDFNFQPRAQASVSSSLSRVLERYPAENVVGGPLDIIVGPDGTVVVSGMVRSEKAAALALAMVRLEPGVRNVVDQLVIAEEGLPPALPQP
ncbi:MAG: BON domain-containing protein [Maioricimonas sp. JB049]